MVWERHDGATREVTWGELQDLANRAAHVLARARRRQGRPRRRRPAADRGDRRDLLRHLEARRDPALDVGALRRRRASATGSGTPSRRSSSPTPPTPTASTPRWSTSSSSSTTTLLAGAPTDHVCEDTSADDPAQLYYTSGTTGKAKGIVHAHRYILAHEEFVYCHDVQRRRALPRDGGVGLGGRDLARCSARGGSARSSASTSARAASTRAKQLDFLSRHEVTNVFTTPTAMRAMMAIDDAGERYPQQVPRSSARPASRSTPRRSAGSASSTGSPSSTTTG